MAAVFYTCAAVALSGLATTMLLLPPTPVGNDNDGGSAGSGKNNEPSETSSLLAA